MASLLGWGLPGLPLALLIRDAPHAPALLARALGLGFGYIFLTGLIYATLVGHAPGRIPFLLLIALPCIWLSVKPPSVSSATLEVQTIGYALATSLLLIGILWPYLHRASLNGDGTEVYELARSLEASPAPRWDLEATGPEGRFGTPITVPFFSGAYLVSAEMAVLGQGELAARLPFVMGLTLLGAIALSLTSRATPLARIYAVSVGAVFLLWQAIYATYEPAFPEIAESAGTDTLTIAVWLAGFRELMFGSRKLGIAFFILASGVTYAAPVLAVIAISILLLYDRAAGKEATKLSLVATGIVLPLVLFLGWQGGELSTWWRQIAEEYVVDYARSASPGSRLSFVFRVGLITGGLPLVAFHGWSRLHPASRILWWTGGIYLVVILSGGEQVVHYLSPLPWLFLPAAIDAASRSRVLASVGVVVLVATFALSWPIDGNPPRTENASLGRESCIQGLTYEAAALAADPIYGALDRPPRSARFAVGKHTFVRYAMDLGGYDCVVGISEYPPPGALSIVEGPISIWTTDLDRYAQWRFLQIRPPRSVLFRQDSETAYPQSAADWSQRIDLETEPGRSLRLSEVHRGAEAPGLSRQIKVLVPIPMGTRQVTLYFDAPPASQVEATVNGQAPLELDLSAGQQWIELETGWRPGWNILTIGGASGSELSRLDIR